MAYCLIFDSGCATTGVNHAEKHFMKLITVANFIKLFWHNLSPQWHIAISFDSAMVVNHAKKHFIKLTTATNFIKLFWHNLRCYWCIALSFYLGYAARGINDAKKFYEIEHKTGKDNGIHKIFFTHPLPFTYRVP